MRDKLKTQKRPQRPKQYQLIREEQKQGLITSKKEIQKQFEFFSAIPPEAEAGERGADDQPRLGVKELRN